MSDNSGPAFPELHALWEDRNGGGYLAEISPSLTKRELFAAMAMQGMFSNPAQFHQDTQTIAGMAIVMADTLIAELQK